MVKIFQKILNNMQDRQISLGKVLMTTEKLDINDSIFAFSHLWIKTIAEQVEQLTIIALSVGEYDLPKNVTVYSLGKEQLLSDRKPASFFLPTGLGGPR